MCILSTINSLGRHNELIILGDFNSYWLHCSSHKDRNLFDGVHLTQLINEPTRVDYRSSSLLDWILVSNPDRIVKSGVMSYCLSDHSIIFCVWKIKVPRSPPKFITFRQCKHINEDNFIYDLISINWDRFQLIPYIEEAWNFFYSEINTFIEKHAPMKTVRVKGSHLPWISSELLSLFKQRDKAWAIYRASRDSTDWDTYRSFRNQCTVKPGTQSLSQNVHNPRHFWKRLNLILNRNNKNVLSQIQFNNEPISDPSLIPHDFNNHFISCSSFYFDSYWTASPLIDHYLLENAHATNPTGNFFCELQKYKLELNNLLNKIKKVSY